MDIPHKQHLTNVYQNVFQISHGIRKLDHILNNRPWLRCSWIVFPQVFSVVSAYKDPVEIQHMKKIFDKFVTGFFVVVLGMLWYCSTKYYVRTNHHSIIAYNVFGEQVKIDEIRTEFKNYQVAQSYISDYQEKFPHYDFSLASDIHELKNNSVPRILKRFRDNGFSYEW